MSNSACQNKILFVDDEAQARKYFEKAYRGDFEIITVGDTAGARRVLCEQADAIGVLVTDQRMPGESGVSLLKHVRQHYPQIMRILTTAYSDIDSAIDAVNAGAIFRYVTKPWDIHELRGILQQAMKTHELQRERDALVREKIGCIQHGLLIDRARSFMVLARSLKGRIQNPMHGFQTFLMLSQHLPLAEPDAQHAHGDVWGMMVQQSKSLLEAVDDVLEHLVPTRMMQVGAETLTSALWTDRRGQGIVVEVDGPRNEQIPSILADVSMIRTAVSAAAEVLAGGRLPGRLRISVTPTEIEQAAGVRFVLHAVESHDADGDDLPEPTRQRTAVEAKVLTICLVMAHHCGKVTFSEKQAWMDLPCDPAQATFRPLTSNWVEQVLESVA